MGARGRGRRRSLTGFQAAVPGDGTTRWPRQPLIYEINTCVWLEELSRTCGRPVTLASVPGQVWDSIAGLRVDAVWLMGVWERSPAGIAVANRNEALLADFRRALADYRPEDNIGSAYCVRRYVADERLGGSAGLAEARAQLSRRGLRLILDFVPNHVARDHPWAADHPEYFVQGTAEDAAGDPASFVELGKRVLALGRDPFFPAWEDVLQLNAFHPGLRRAAAATLADIGGQCDGVRCDMAMLLVSSVFQSTWGDRPGPAPAAEYWSEVIAATKGARPDFLFVAEAYWDLEWELQRQGFDYCYDKRLYDRLEGDAAEGVRLHLCADLAYQERLVRFIENHDEPRALAAFSAGKARAAAVTMATIPGARLFHEGQFEGRTVRIPVFLARRPAEPADPDVRSFYRTLLRAASSEAVRGGHWRLCERTGWPDNASHRRLVAWCWRSAAERLLVVVNLSDSGAQGRVLVPWDDLAGRTWQMTDAFSGRTYERSGDEMGSPGLYVDLAPWGYHVLNCWLPVGSGSAP